MVHLGDAVRNVESVLPVVRDDDRGGVVLAQDTQYLIADSSASFRVQVAEGFVHEHQAWSTHERSRDGHALLLATTQLVRVAATEAFQTNSSQLIGYALLPLGRGQAVQPEGDVAVHGEVREERQPLENETDPAFLRGDEHVRAGEDLVPEMYFTVGRFFETRDEPEQGGFSATARPHDDQRFALAQGKVHAVEDGPGAVGEGQA